MASDVGLPEGAAVVGDTLVGYMLTPVGLTDVGVVGASDSHS